VALHDEVTKLRAKRIEEQGHATPDEFQGVTKDKIRSVLGYLDLGGNVDLVDGVFALLDDETESWFAKPPDGARFCSGATTAHLACHIGILQRGSGKLDREGRDYWIKPLRELGGIETITLQDGEFIAGHVKAKSPNFSYCLNDGLEAILKAPEDRWRAMLQEWVQEDVARERRTFQAEMAEASRKLVDSGHAHLIKASVEHYVPRVLPGYQLLYIDDSEGDRISDAERAKMQEAGVELTLEDAIPDALLWNPETNRLWIIEAVTSDGEVDMHKVTQMKRMAKRCGKSGIGFTTTYRTWKEAATRQGVHKNIAVDTYVWIQADPSKQFLVKA